MGRNILLPQGKHHEKAHRNGIQHTLLRPGTRQVPSALSSISLQGTDPEKSNSLQEPPVAQVSRMQEDSPATRSHETA